MRETELYFPSSDGTSEIRALLWEPDDLVSSGKNARCMLQIFHGMAEHIARYRGFAEYCTQQGFIVFGHDDVGHGKSVASPEQWGHMPKNGKTVLVEDAHQLHKMMLERFSSAPPSVMLGHSMGSFVLRLYLAQYGDDVKAAIISGTGQLSPLLSSGGSLLARLLSTFRGNEYRSPFLHNLSVGAYSKQIEGARTPLDWLSTDEAVVDEYIASPDCGFMMDASGTVALTDLTGTMVKRAVVAAVPAELPLLFIAGTEDPVGEKGAGVKRAEQLFRDTGHTDVTLILYEGMRHEVLNETEKDRVYSDIMNWLDERL
ncbi:MAG: lysophospholipase [Coriobacteriia bacterium]|nr:lysophospholipase [Coriobacteriia bacterium]MCL2750819.1 lysophospholipase [Coriobacteriia bacterium]